MTLKNDGHKLHYNVTFGGRTMTKTIIYETPTKEEFDLLIQRLEQVGKHVLFLSGALGRM